MAATPKHTSFVTTDDPRRLSPIEAALMDQCNLAHRARRVGDTEALSACRAEIRRLLHRYDATDGDGHPHPAWARPNQRAMAYSALGEIERAVETEIVALRYADTPRRVEVSAGNIADRLLRLGRADEAVGYALTAWDAAPASVPVIVTAARALYHAGRPGEAQELFTQLRRAAEHMGPTSELATTLRHEHELEALAEDLPALRDLFDWLDTLEDDR
ncbi:MAG: tetratricopeptide repeat protein [Phycisphaerales bacterium]